MKSSRSLGDEFRFHTFESANLPGWSDAKKILADKGRVVAFH